MNTLRTRAAIGIVLIILGCSKDFTAPRPADIGRPLGTVIELPPCSNTGLNTGGLVLSGLKKFWACGSVVNVSGPTARQAEIQAATNAWKTALRHPAVTGIPLLHWTAGTGNVQVVISGASNASGWCGGTDDPPTQIIMTADGPTTCPDYVADFTTVLTHELAHVLGYTQALEGPNGVVPTNCALHLPSSGAVCQHEIEYLYAGYGFRAAPDVGFWSLRFVTGVQVSPLTVTVQATQSQAVTASGLIFNRQTPYSEPLGTASIAWSSDNPTTIASVNSSGTVTGIAAGSTIVRARVSGLGSTYQLGAVMTSRGQEIPVTVTAGPPPGTGFRVTSINGVTSPITTAGTYGLNASVPQQPAGTLQIAWKIVYSTAPLDTLRVAYGPNSYSLNVPAGSYNIRVYATPRSGSGTNWVYGAEGIQDFPVCTGGGDGRGDLAAPVGDDGQDAVGGC